MVEILAGATGLFHAALAHVYNFQQVTDWAWKIKSPAPQERLNQ